MGPQIGKPVEITEEVAKKIARLYTENGLSVNRLRDRYGGTRERIEKALESQGVKLRRVRGMREVEG